MNLVINLINLWFNKLIYFFWRKWPFFILFFEEIKWILKVFIFIGTFSLRLIWFYNLIFRHIFLYTCRIFTILRFQILFWTRLHDSLCMIKINNVIWRNWWSNFLRHIIEFIILITQPTHKFICHNYDFWLFHQTIINNLSIFLLFVQLLWNQLPPFLYLFFFFFILFFLLFFFLINFNSCLPCFLFCFHVIFFFLFCRFPFFYFFSLLNSLFLCWHFSIWAYRFI